MSKKINVAIIGLGFGAEFIPIYQAHPHARLVAVCQRDPKKLRAIQDAFGIPKGYTDYDELLRDPEIDAVHINTPIPDHAAQSIKALQAGKHVACTVPMATSIADCRRIVDLTKRTGLKYMMMETVVYAREFLYLKELYERGDLGKDPVPAGEPPAGHGRLAELLARPAADVVRDPLRRPDARAHRRRRGVRLLLRLRHDPPGTGRPLRLALRGGDGAHETARTATSRRASSARSSTSPANTARASTSTARSSRSSGR
jgi:hypothetical protein